MNNLLDVSVDLNGAAMGNMVCIHNIIAVCSILGIFENH